MLDYTAPGGKNELGDTYSKWGAEHHWPPAGDGPEETPCHLY